MWTHFNKSSGATTFMLLLMLFLAAPSSFGQRVRADLITNIPFPFAVGNQVLPPGRYTITAEGHSYVWIQTPGMHGILVLTHSAENQTPVSVGKLIFHRYGDVYFLAQIREVDKSTGRQLFGSKAEKEFANRARSASHRLSLAQQMNNPGRLEEIEINAGQ